MDSSLKMDLQVNAIMKCCFFTSAILCRKHLTSIIHAFITSTLDFSNTILLGFNKTTLA